VGEKVHQASVEIPSELIRSKVIESTDFDLSPSLGETNTFRLYQARLANTGPPHIAGPFNRWARPLGNRSPGLGPGLRDYLCPWGAETLYLMAPRI